MSSRARSTVAGQVFEAGRMLVFRPGDRHRRRRRARPARGCCCSAARRLEGPRYIWWNFVASSQEKIEAAKEAWRREDRQRFDLPPDDRDEFIPAP